MRQPISVVGLALGLLLAASVDAETVSVRVRRNPEMPAGADADGRVLLFTPKPIRPGSTHSHFDSSATPNLLMEPAFSSDLKVFEVDLTRQAMQDLGWLGGEFGFQMIYSDAAGEGFNDAQTGAARKEALEMAVGAWSLILGSAVNINVEAKFEPRRCEIGSGTLAAAGPQFVFRDFGGGEPGTWYAGPLAESLVSDDLSAAQENNADLTITINSGIDEECLGPGSRFYYGLDNDVPPGQISFVTVAMHELGHGLGFVGLVDEETGEQLDGIRDIFSALTYDTKKRKHWDEMTDAGRRRSAKRPCKVVFDGQKTAARAARFLKGRAVVEIDSMRDFADGCDVGEASFGPKLKKRGFSGDLALADDGSDNPTLGCLPFVNGDEISGAIAVIDRGECLFTEKVKNAQDAGALGVIIVNNVNGLPPGLGGSDDSIRIPAVSISKKNGRKIKRVLRRE